MAQQHRQDSTGLGGAVRFTEERKRREKESRWDTQGPACWALRHVSYSHHFATNTALARMTVTEASWHKEQIKGQRNRALKKRECEPGRRCLRVAPPTPTKHRVGGGSCGEQIQLVITVTAILSLGFNVWKALAMLPSKDAPSRMWGCLLLHGKPHVGLSFSFFPLGWRGGRNGCHQMETTMNRMARQAWMQPPESGRK